MRVESGLRKLAAPNDGSKRNTDDATTSKYIDYYINYNCTQCNPSYMQRVEDIK